MWPIPLNIIVDWVRKKWSQLCRFLYQVVAKIDFEKCIKKEKRELHYNGYREGFKFGHQEGYKKGCLEGYEDCATKHIKPS